MINREQGRIVWVDIAKFLCISCVIFSHLDFQSDFLRCLYAPFFLNLFSFLSGYVYKPRDSFRHHLLHKARGLLLPWFLFSNGNLLLSWILTFQGERNIPGEMAANLLQVRGYYDGMWYIAALFAAYIPFYFVIKQDRPGIAVMTSFALAVVSRLYVWYTPDPGFPWNSPSLPWHLEYIFQMMFWMVLGYYFKGEQERRFDRIPNWKMLAGAVGYCLSACAISCAGLVSCPIMRTVGNYVVEFLGIGTVIFISKRIHANKAIVFFGMNTLCYFGMHGKAFEIVQKILELCMGEQYAAVCADPISAPIVGMMITAVVLFGLILPIAFINRYLPWMAGKQKIHK